LKDKQEAAKKAGDYSGYSELVRKAGEKLRTKAAAIRNDADKRLKNGSLGEGLSGAVEPMMGEDGTKQKKKRINGKSSLVPDLYQNTTRDVAYAI